MHSLRKKLRKSCHSEEPIGDEESTHCVDIYGQIGAKVLRRASLAQDDRFLRKRNRHAQDDRGVGNYIVGNGFIRSAECINAFPTHIIVGNGFIRSVECMNAFPTM